MGFLAGLPWGKIGVGVGASLFGNWLSNRSRKSALERTPEELAALRGGQGAATGLADQGRMLTGAGMPYATGAGNYWQTLLSGNRAAMAQATAGPRAALTDQYRGAERGLERSGLRGGVRDLASAELSRDRAGKIAGLTTGVQPAAAENLAGLGTALTGQGTAAMIGGGNIWANLLRAGAENRFQANEAGRDTASAFGKSIFDILTGTSSGAGAAAGTTSTAAAGTTSTAAFDPITGAKFTDTEPKVGGSSFWHKLFSGFKRVFGGKGGSRGGSPETEWWKQYLASGLPGGGGGNPGGGYHPPI